MFLRNAEAFPPAHEHLIGESLSRMPITDGCNGIDFSSSDLVLGHQDESRPLGAHLTDPDSIIALDTDLSSRITLPLRNHCGEANVRCRAMKVGCIMQSSSIKII